jgi:hypothetical protein
VANGELPAAEALRRAPFPEDHAREALRRAAVTYGYRSRSLASRRSSSRYSQTRVTSTPKAAYHSM